MYPVQTLPEKFFGYIHRRRRRERMRRRKSGRIMKKKMREKDGR
jgi:hypothetical protein